MTELAASGGPTTALCGWGGYPVRNTRLLAPANVDAMRQLLANHRGIVARGNGRSYGDASLGEEISLDMRAYRRILAFDHSLGRLSVESGALLSDILSTIVPKGFFLPVVPGTKHVTVGGMIAADVHGKNHHVDGGFGDHVEELGLLLPTGDIARCSPRRNSDLFQATIGGMGLTGTILDATIRLRPIETGWIRQQTIVAENFDAAIEALNVSATYSVAWIDCLARGRSLGRSLVYLGEHATRRDAEVLARGRPEFPEEVGELFSIPVTLPDFTSSLLSIGAFNALYFRRGAMGAARPFLSHWDRYFFPLDGIGAWNRIYGRRGFLQHQCVVPEHNGKPVLAGILDRVAAAGTASLFAVLKRLGGSSGTLSFPLPGYTLAMDFPAKPEIFPLLDEIDALVVRGGGRLYLAKDARQSRPTFEAGYSNADRFRELRRATSASGHHASGLSLRLGL